MLITFAVALALTFLIDMVELLRRASGKDDATFWVILKIAFYRLPNLSQQMAPFVVLFSAILSFTKLAKSSELAVARASGLSVWQFLLPSITTAAILGVFVMAVFNPLAAIMHNKAEHLNDKYLEYNLNQFLLNKGGLWVKQQNLVKDGELVIHALRSATEEVKLFDVIIFEYGLNGVFNKRIDAKSALLEGEYWRLEDVLINKPDNKPVEKEELFIVTNITPEDIQENFVDPDTLSFWALPGFIDVLEKAGFSSVKHKQYYNSLLALPATFVTMVLVAAVFTIKFNRRGKSGYLIVSAIIAGFVFYFFTKLSAGFGLAGTIPLWASAWLPTLVYVMILISFLLHIEEN